MENFLIISAVVLALAGTAGSILPVLPGAIFNFAALVLLYFIERGEDPSLYVMVIFSLLAVAVLAADYILPVAGAKRFGASKQGMFGAILGMLAGLSLFGPLGIVLGTLAGVVVGEMLSGKELTQAIRAGLAGVGGNIVAITIKTGLSLAMTGYLFFKLFS